MGTLTNPQGLRGSETGGYGVAQIMDRENTRGTEHVGCGTRKGELGFMYTNM